MSYICYKEKTNTIHGVLFDMDGVVLDTEKLYARFWAEAAHALGYPMTYEQALGMRSLNSAAGQAKLESYFGPGVSRAIMRDKRVELMDSYVAEFGVEAKPGIHELLDYLKGQGIRTAIATSSPMPRATAYLGSLDLLDKFDRICSGHDVKQGKPAPDIYLHAAASIGIPPENCLVLEDSRNGLKAAKAAGCTAVVVPDLDPAPPEELGLWDYQAESLHQVIPVLEKLGYIHK